MADPDNTAPPSLAGDVARMREQIGFLVDQVAALAENDTKMARVAYALIDRAERAEKTNGLLIGTCRQLQAQIEGLALLGRVGRAAAAQPVRGHPRAHFPHSLGSTPAEPGA